MKKKAFLGLMVVFAFLICIGPSLAPLLTADGNAPWADFFVAQALQVSGTSGGSTSSSAKTSTNPIKKITVSPTKPKGTTGDMVSLKVTFSPYNPSDLTISYTKTTLELLSTVPDGKKAVTYTFKITGKPKKKANVTFKSKKSKKVSKKVTVTISTVSVKGVKVNPDDEALVIGDTLALDAAISPMNATEKGVTWSTSNKKVATVSKSGVVTAKNKGVATVTVKTKSGSKKAKVKISVGSKPVAAKAAPDSSYQKEFESQVLQLINDERTQRGLKKLVLDDDLKQGARVRAYEQETLYSHTRPSGAGWQTVLAVRPNIYYGEILFKIISSPQGAVNGWMQSSGHKAAILKKEYTSAGVGVYQDNRGNLYWCVLFASF